VREHGGATRRESKRVFSTFVKGYESLPVVIRARH
jgi:hypothetical protein